MRLLYEYSIGPQQPLWVSGLSNLTVFGLLFTAIGVYKHHNCVEKGCPRLSHHPVEGTTFKTCRKHATIEVHDRLASEHAEKFPEQHALLHRKTKVGPQRGPDGRWLKQ